MKNTEIRKLWEEFIEKYKQYFISNEELWINTLKQVKQYININNTCPPQHNKKTHNLGCWLSTQKKNYIKNQHSMKNIEIRKLWKEFVKEYNEYFISNEEIWMNTLEKIKEYINVNNKLPSKHDKIKEIQSLGRWLVQTKIKYKRNQYIMKNPEIRKLWEEFIKEYNN